MRGIRTITMDLDDTLWPIGPAIERADRRLYAWLHERYPRITERYTCEAIFAVRDEVIREHADRSHDSTFLRKSVLGRIGKAAGYGTDMVDDAFAIFDEERNIVDVYPDVRPALERLRSSFSLIALTNGNANLDKIGLRDLFDGIVSAATAGAAKPAPEIFAAAVRAGGASVNATVHVGDHPAHDVHGARLAGLRTVWVNRNGYEWPAELPLPDGVVADIGELAGLLVGSG